MMTRIYLLLFVVSTLVACDDSDKTFCMSGEVVAYAACGGYSVIEVDPNQSIGGEVEINQITYKNAIQVPGQFSLGRGYFKIREYREADAELASNDIFFCLSMYIPLAIPSYTALERNDSHCP